MNKCAECGESDSLLYSCSLCNLKYCEEHRLPESHDCLGLKSYSDSTKWFQNKEEEQVGKEIDVSNRHVVDKPDEATSLVWRCQECGHEYSTNQKDCVECGGNVFEPVQVSIQKKRELLPETKFKREKRKENRQDTKTVNQEDNQDTKTANQKNEVVEIDIYEFEKPLSMRIKESILGKSNTSPFENIRSDIFVWDHEDDEIIRRFKQSTSQENPIKFLMKYYSTSRHGDTIHLNEEGSRVYTLPELNSRYPFRLSHIAEYSWDQRNDILFK